MQSSCPARGGASACELLLQCSSNGEYFDSKHVVNVTAEKHCSGFISGHDKMPLNWRIDCNEWNSLTWKCHIVDIVLNQTRVPMPPPHPPKGNSSNFAKPTDNVTKYVEKHELLQCFPCFFFKKSDNNI